MWAPTLCCFHSLGAITFHQFYVASTVSVALLFTNFMLLPQSWWHYFSPVLCCFHSLGGITFHQFYMASTVSVPLLFTSFMLLPQSPWHYFSPVLCGFHSLSAITVHQFYRGHWQLEAYRGHSCRQLHADHNRIFIVPVEVYKICLTVHNKK